VVLREFSEFLVAAVMPETPSLVFALSIMVVAVYAARNGLEVIARCADYLLPFMVAFALTIVLLALPEIRLEHLFPLGERGWVPVLASALVAFLFVGEVVILAAFGGLVNPPPGLRASLISGLLGIGFFWSS